MGARPNMADSSPLKTVSFLVSYNLDIVLRYRNSDHYQQRGNSDVGRCVQRAAIVYCT